jgi:hypothetical protein
MTKMALIGCIFGVTLLVGCGGGNNDTTETTSTETETPTTSQADTTCRASGNTVLVPEGTQCTYSIASLNGGSPQPYSCSNGKVTSNGISATSITFNGVTFICE